MSYTAPTLRSTGDLITASIWNTDIVNNIIAGNAGAMSIASQAALDFVYALSSSQLARLVKGTGSQVPRINAAATAWEFASVPGLKVGSFASPTSGGTQAITGVGFKPRVVIFAGAVNGDVLWSVGFDDGTTAMSLDQSLSVATNQIAATGVSILVGNARGVNSISGKITTLGSDGFTITWTLTGSVGAGTILYLAIG